MRSQRSEAIKRGMAKRAEAGYHLHRVPVGYRRVWRDGMVEIEPDPIQSVHVHQAFYLMATGKYSLRKLLALMTGRGLRTASGKKMSIASFHNMLTNSFYAGLIKEGDNLIRGRHKAVISLQAYYNVESSQLVKRLNLP